MRLEEVDCFESGVRIAKGAEALLATWAFLVEKDAVNED
jgi:hypothetical protein